MLGNDLASLACFQNPNVFFFRLVTPQIDNSSGTFPKTPELDFRGRPEDGKEKTRDGRRSKWWTICSKCSRG